MGILIRVAAVIIHDLMEEIRKLEDKPSHPDESVPNMAPMEFPPDIPEGTIVARQFGFSMERK